MNPVSRETYTSNQISPPEKHPAKLCNTERF